MVFTKLFFCEGLIIYYSVAIDIKILHLYIHTKIIYCYFFIVVVTVYVKITDNISSFVDFLRIVLLFLRSYVKIKRRIYLSAA